MPDTPTPALAEQTAPLQVSAPVTRVAGRLSDRDRLAVRREVEALVAGYVTAAFLDPGTAPDELFPGFTDGATRLARAQGAVLSRADLDADARATRRRCERRDRRGGQRRGARERPRADGATGRRHGPARPDADGDPTARRRRRRRRAATGAGRRGRREDVRLRGRLLLTPVGQGWQIFGFDVIRTGR